jgi:N6-adenosine-specific RNA methylase IME4
MVRNEKAAKEFAARKTAAASAGTPPWNFSAAEVLYADPPWRWDFSISKSRRVENQYPTMPLEDICALRPPVADDAALFLWTPNCKLRGALDVLAAWGFAYQDLLVWDKVRMGMGYWFRNYTELLLIGARGNLPPPPPSLSLGDVYLRQKRGAHSRKPAIVRDMISACYPNAVKVELFARERAPGWISWGNEVGVFPAPEKREDWRRCDEFLGPHSTHRHPLLVLVDPGTDMAEIAKAYREIEEDNEA